MQRYTIVVNQDELKQLMDVYKGHLVSVDNPYITFAALHNKTQIIAYQTGKVLLQGESIFEELMSIKKILNRVDFSAVGSDEVGTGDVFGPVCVCSVFVDKRYINSLERLGVRDSKNMSDEHIMKLAPQLAKQLPHSLLILNPLKFNELTQKNYNMNKIKALLHNQAILKTVAKIEKQVPVILDQFCTPNFYFNYLKDEIEIYQKIHFYTKAESVHIAVAAASIIARYAFLVKMNEYSKKIGIKLLKGASKSVDLQVERILSEKGEKVLGHVAKTSFKNVEKVLLERR